METSEVPPQPESTASFASGLVLEIQQAILQHETNAMAGNVEAVHDMRVGVRRLRVAIKNFAACFTKTDRQRWRDSMERLADTLGGVRDLDVMIETLRAHKAAIASTPIEEQTALETFIRRLEARRKRRLRKLLAYFQGEQYAAFKREFSASDAATTSGGQEVSHEQAA